MRKPVITGIGPVTPAGTGRESFWDSMSKGTSVINNIKKFSSMPGARGGEVPEQDIDEYIDGRKFRRAADISKNALIAVSSALKDSGIESIGDEDSALVVGVTHGAINYSQQYHRSLLEGEEDVSPLLFSDSVLNAPAGNGSICFDIKGAVHTVVGDITASIKAVMLACGKLKAGSVSRSIVVSAEEINELTFFCRTRLGETDLSEGAGALVIENAVHSAAPYCTISGYASYFNAVDPGNSLEQAVERALIMADISKDELDFAFVDGFRGKADQYLNDIPTGSTARFMGNAFNVTAAWNIMLSAVIIRKGIFPAVIMKGKTSENFIHIEKGNILVCNSEVNGASSAIILSRY